MNDNVVGYRGLLRIAAEEIVGKDGKDAVRVTTTLSLEQNDDLKRLANANRVKVAWLVRKAVEDLLDRAKANPKLSFPSDE